MQGLTISLEELIDIRHFAFALQSCLQKKRVTSLQGNLTSVFRGRGVDFLESRLYRPGDDIRCMDWRVTARTHEPHTKIYEEDRDKQVFILVDNSETMQFGTRVSFKSVTATKAAALFAWCAFQSGHRVGGLTFSDKDYKELPSRSRMQNVLRFLKMLCHVDEKKNQPSSLNHALLRSCLLTKSGSIVYIISDFSQFDKESEKLFKQLTQRHEVVVNFIYDPLEMSLPYPDYYCFTDGREKLIFDAMNKKANFRYEEEFQRHYKMIKELSLRCNAEWIETGTHQDMIEIIKQSLQKRK